MQPASPNKYWIASSGGPGVEVAKCRRTASRGHPQEPGRWGRTTPGGTRRHQRPGPAESLGTLSAKRRKLLDLYYRDGISRELFSEEERRLCAAIEAVRSQASEETKRDRDQSELQVRFEQVAGILQNLDIEAVWAAAEDQERRVLIEELVEWVCVFPDHLEVTVNGAPPLNVRYGEVGLKESDVVGVGGGT
jgi:hypothetical protein